MPCWPRCYSRHVHPVAASGPNTCWPLRAYECVWPTRRKVVWFALNRRSSAGEVSSASLSASVCRDALTPRAKRHVRPGVAYHLLAAPGSTATVPAQAPQPLSQNAKITLDQNGLSVDVQDQDLSAVVERIAELARIELRHPEGMPNRRVSIRFSSLPVVNGLKRIFRAAEVPGYLLHTAKQGDNVRVQRIVFLPEEGTTGTSAGRGAQRAPQVVAAQPPQPPRPAPARRAPWRSASTAYCSATRGSQSGRRTYEWQRL